MILPVYAKIDLTSGTWERYPISEEMFRKYLGGKTMGCRLLTDLTPAGLEVFDPASVVIINTGPMNDTGAPSSGRFNMTFKNVMTGGIASSNCGGSFGTMLKKAGFDGLILTGKAAEYVKITVADGDITITPCPELVGLDAEETQKKLPSRYGKLVIGPAGEHLVNYASAVSGERVAGRCGAGAVLGAKNVKAVIAYGTHRTELHDKEKFDRYNARWIKMIRNHPMTGESLPRYGSAGLVSKAQISGVLPTENFSCGRYEEFEMVSGEIMAENALTRNDDCISCPIRCERRVMVDGKEVKGPEYETLGLFGANIRNSDLQTVMDVNYDADLLGMDTISLAGTIAFALELQKRGMADFGLQFTNSAELREVVRKIAYREGKIGELADGSKVLSERYGGKEFAIHSKGLELAAYEPRRSVGMGLGYATSNRGGCHLNGGYLALLESVGVIGMDAQTPKGKPELAIFFQNTMEAASAAGFCLFTLQATIPGVLFHFGPTSIVNRIAGSALLLARGVLGILWKLTPGILPIHIMLVGHAKSIQLATGIKMSLGDFVTAGERGFNLERLYNLREGLTAADDSLPERLTKTPQDPDDPTTVVPLDVMLPRYYAVRGWDANGAPTEKRLKKLGIL